jgi:cytochrome c peroxidase
MRRATGGAHALCIPNRALPYMHDGSLATLAVVVHRYSQGGIPNPFLDREIRPLNLSDEEKKDLVAFLESFTGNIRFRDTGVQIPTKSPM